MKARELFQEYLRRAHFTDEPLSLESQHLIGAALAELDNGNVRAARALYRRGRSMLVNEFEDSRWTDHF